MASAKASARATAAPRTPRPGGRAARPVPPATLDGDVPAGTPGDIADPSLADAGSARIEWAERAMPVLQLLRDRFARSGRSPACPSRPA